MIAHGFEDPAVRNWVCLSLACFPCKSRKRLIREEEEGGGPCGEPPNYPPTYLGYVGSRALLSRVDG